MVIGFLLPGGPTNLADPSQLLVAAMLVGLGIAVAPDLGILLGRDDGSGSDGFDGLVAIPGIVGTIAA